MQSIYGKILTGAALTDDEVLDGYEFFQQLANNLEQLGPRFHFAFSEANRVSENLRQFKNYRRI